MSDWVLVYICVCVHIYNGHMYLENSGLNSSLEEHLFQSRN